MKSRRSWTLDTLAEHEGQWLFLGDGSVAVTYTLLDKNRVRVSFYVAAKGHFEHCVTDTGDARKLIQILCKQAVRTRSQMTIMRLRRASEGNGRCNGVGMQVRRAI